MLGQLSLELQAVIADTLQQPGARMTARERIVEAGVGAAFAVAVAGVWILAPPHAFAFLPAVICFLVLAAALQVRVDTPFGFTVPAQLAFVPLLFAMPLALVPLAVVLASMVARVPDMLRGQAPLQPAWAVGRERLVGDRARCRLRGRQRVPCAGLAGASGGGARSPVRRRLCRLGPALRAREAAPRSWLSWRTAGSTSSTPGYRASRCSSPTTSSRPPWRRSHCCRCWGSWRCSPASVASASKACWSSTTPIARHATRRSRLRR